MDPLASPPPRWIYCWLWAAGVYNLAWGVVNVLWPNLLFDLTGAARPHYPEIWQCVGMIVGVYGIGYLIAARDSRTHWPIVLVGLLGKICGPLGFAWSVARGVFPPAFGLTLLTNDLIWWIPFALILWDALLHQRRVRPDASRLKLFVRESTIAATPEEVFRFHERPDAFQTLMPPWEPLQIVRAAGSLEPGAQAVLRGWMGPLPVEWVATHTEYDPPRMFADRQDVGPFAWWLHRHLCRADGQGGTVLRDEIEYALPLGLVGAWLGGWMIRRKLDRTFAYRHEATRKLLESESRAAATAGSAAAAK